MPPKVLKAEEQFLCKFILHGKKQISSEIQFLVFYTTEKADYKEGRMIWLLIHHIQPYYPHDKRRILGHSNSRRQQVADIGWETQSDFRAYALSHSSPLPP